MALSALEAFAGGALAGGLDTYGQLQTEQRKFKVDEMKAQAEYNRQLNMRRAVKGMETAGIDPVTGQEITREDYALLQPDQQSKIMGPLAIKEKEVDMQNALKASPWIDPTTKQQLTWGELKARGNTEGLISENQYREQLQDRQNAAVAGRQEAAAIRAEKRHDARVQIQMDKAEKAAAEADFNKMENAVLSARSEVIKGYNKDEELYPRITGNKADDLALYQMDATLQIMGNLKGAMSTEAYDKFISRNPTFKEAEATRRLVDTAVQSDDPVGYINSVPGLKDDPKAKKKVFNYMQAQGYNLTSMLTSR